MDRFTGVFMNYSSGTKKQHPRYGIIKITNFNSRESGKVIGWWVGWPEKNPKFFGRILGTHGRSGSLMTRFKHGLPGQAIGGKVVITKIKSDNQIRESLTTSKKMDRGSKIIEIEGIGPQYAEKLNTIEIYTTSDLLEAGSTPIQRKELADKTGIAPKLILEWVNISDLFRIKGVGEEYADLLEEAGVDTIIELSNRNAANLHNKILEVNVAKKLVRRVPTLKMVERWVNEAKTMPRKVEY